MPILAPSESHSAAAAIARSSFPAVQNPVSAIPVRQTLLPKHLDEKVARLHLDALGFRLTELTKIQAEYLGVDVAGPYKTDSYRY